MKYSVSCDRRFFTEILLLVEVDSVRHIRVRQRPRAAVYMGIVDT